MAYTENWIREDVEDIRLRAKTGYTPVCSFGARRHLPHFQDIVLLPATLSRLVVDAHKEPCSAKTVLGARNARQPLELETPIMIAPMSFGALSKKAKMALAKGSAMVGSAHSTGEGGMLPEERELATTLYYQCTPGRYGFNGRDLRRSDCVEFFLGQGAKPGFGGVLRQKKVTDEIALQRKIPRGIDLFSPCRHCDVLGPDDLVTKVLEFREATDWRIPVSFKIGAGRVREDVKIAVKCGADIIAIDGMQGGTGASPKILLDNVGIPTLAAICQARQALEEIGMEEEIDLVLLGGIRNGADVAKALALGAKAVAIGTAAMIALGCKVCLECHSDRCPTGIATHDPARLEKLDVEQGARAVANLIHAMTEEVMMLTKACGKTDIHNLEREDLRALTTEASAYTGLPVVGGYVPTITPMQPDPSRNGSGTRDCLTAC